MTIKMKMTGRRTGRHTLRSSAAVAAILGVSHDQPTAHQADGELATEATRRVLASTSREWNALRHAC
jgi:hypothetical protein